MEQGMRRALVAVCLVFVGCSSPGGSDAGEDAGRDDAGVDAGADSGVISPNELGWWRDQVFYEVFVRSFADSDGDGHGDFAGLTAKLDYLNDGDPATTSDLGVDALWLMPIYPSSSYHGYDVTNYEATLGTYGSIAEFDALVTAAHQRGIKLILDFVPNHTASSHPWFQNARGDTGATYRDYYVWSDTDPGWRRPTDSAALWHSSPTGYYYGYFTSGMPDLNWRNPEVQRQLTDAMHFWLTHGVDGFRIDAARYLVESPDGGISEQPETHAAMRAVRAELHRDFPQALFVAEAWASHATAVTYYGEGDEYQLAFAFDAADALVSSINAGDASALINALARGDRDFAGKDPGFDAPFLTNHDMARAMRQLGGDTGAAKVAAAALFSLRGTPFLYYGEELGMSGGSSSDDRDKRTPMRWNATPPTYGFTTRANTWYGASAPEVAGVDVESQQATPSSLWHTYQRLIALRHAHPAIAKGTATLVLDRPAAVFSLLREEGNERVLFVANFSDADAGSFTLAVDGAPTVLAQEGLQGVPAAADGGVVFSGFDPHGYAYVELK